jgi:hypothetical protein
MALMTSGGPIALMTSGQPMEEFQPQAQRKWTFFVLVAETFC